MICLSLSWDCKDHWHYNALATYIGNKINPNEPKSNEKMVSLRKSNSICYKKD